MLQRQVGHRIRFGRFPGRMTRLAALGPRWQTTGHFIVAASRDGPDIKPQALGTLLKLFKAHAGEQIMAILRAEGKISRTSSRFLASSSTQS
jgi:hypothetical protein